MGRKDRKESSESDSSCCESEKEIEEEVIEAIKKLPTIEEKVQAIAMNSYLIQKRQLDEKMQNEINEIEINQRLKYAPQIDEINKIISGQYDFTDADYQEIGTLLTEQEMKNKHNYYTKEPISEYWLKVLIGSDIGGEVRQIDEPLLKHLTKITADKSLDGKKMSAIFEFSQNQWFTNTSLKKQFDLDADTIQRSYGDQINWKEGKNITIKIVKKKKKKGAERKTKEVKEQSFFNLFQAVQVQSEDEQQEEQNEESQKKIEQLQSQYQIVNSLYENIIPRSLEYYLGIVPMDGDMMQDYDQEESDEEPVPKKKKNKKGEAE